MIIEPKIRRNICLTAHPFGCAAQVKAQINYVEARDRIDSPKRVLVIGASNGYGLAARIVSTFSSAAPTIGVAYERPGTKSKTGTAGWYNIESFKKEAEAAGYQAWNINGDAFSREIKAQVLEIIRENLGEIDFLVYSIAAPRRMDPQTGELYSTVIKPIGNTFTSKTVDFLSGKVSEITAEPATEEEIAHTVKVMGGEDWRLWVEMLQNGGVLAENFLTIAFSYIGPDFTKAIYRDGTIGKAKEDLENSGDQINKVLAPCRGKAIISVNKALVTRASAVIPAVPLYISLLYKVMKEKNLHEGCIQQIYRLYHDFLFADSAPTLDDRGRIRLDDWEMRQDVQKKVAEMWQEVTTENLSQLADIDGLRQEFLRHHGFGMPGVDYGRDVEPDIF
ncbi:MAG: trans-2-enoyl-CoA reductase family protein [Deltaproteobacteria bacterium]|jgi:enoyl-[acyl-carrier protein] reductase/trans-2-enoyl-CoA reductase (NAD+)|nr:trans-2-enoyl-CoA reductase family protein [Deltaproteobacteria bacterium]